MILKAFDIRANLKTVYTWQTGSLNVFGIDMLGHVGFVLRDIAALHALPGLPLAIENWNHLSLNF